MKINPDLDSQINKRYCNPYPSLRVIIGKITIMKLKQAKFVQMSTYKQPGSHKTIQDNSWSMI